MNFLTILGTGVGLSMDALAVAMAASVALERVTHRHIFRFAFHFGLFQALMPLLGWLLGTRVARYVSAWDHWVAFALLLAVGCHALYESFKPDRTVKSQRDPTRGWSLVALSLATSLDAFAVGLSFAMIRMQIWYPILVIGLVTGTLTMLGMMLGSRVTARFGGYVERVGALIIIGIGVKILVEHLVA